MKYLLELDGDKPHGNMLRAEQVGTVSVKHHDAERQKERERRRTGPRQLEGDGSSPGNLPKIRSKSTRSRFSNRST